MLHVKTPEDTLQLLHDSFDEIADTETIALEAAFGRILACDVTAEEYVPDFHRSTVDGYAVHSEDTFGCSDSIPAILECIGRVEMGHSAGEKVIPGTCMAVPTGGEVPEGADGMVMIEYTEDYGDGTIGVLKPAAPGLNMVFRGDDVCPGKTVLFAGETLTAHKIGALAAMGRSKVTVRRKLKVGIISTGDELIAPDKVPNVGQIRDVNSDMLSAAMLQAGAIPVKYGIIKDQEELLTEAVKKAVEDCDLVLISGGSSVGEKDATCRVIGKLGDLLLHGIAMKPGKPTIMGKISGKPVIGLPGHPGAAFFITKLFVIPLMEHLSGGNKRKYRLQAKLTEPVGANHGRAQCMSVRLERRENSWYATPIRSKSGLITSLAESDGFFEISRDCEGIAENSTIEVILFDGLE